MSSIFEEFLTQYDPSGPRAQFYVEALSSQIGHLVKENPALAPFLGNMTLVLHGSTACGIDDPFSDIDCWLVLDDAEMAEFDRLFEHRYIPFGTNQKPGHVNPIHLSELNDCFMTVNMNLIHEIRDAKVVVDRKNVFERIKNTARKPMPDEVRHAFFFHNYVEMRSSHRALDNPLARGDEVALLLGISKTVAFALKAGMVLDSAPYPFDKWIHVISHFHPTPKSLLPHVDSIIYKLKTDPHCLAGPESTNPVSGELREIRIKLIRRANEIGIEDLWLEKWWRYIDPAAEAVAQVKWA